MSQGGLIEFQLDTKDWGKILITRVLPRNGDPWGCLAPVRGTPWGDLIPVVSGEVLSHALHGYATPLMRVIGSEPHGLLKKVPNEYRQCAAAKGCLLFTKKHCHPGPKLPDCYVPPGIPPEAHAEVVTVAMAWRAGRYVIVVEGAEFSF